MYAPNIKYLLLIHLLHLNSAGCQTIITQQISAKQRLCHCLQLNALCFIRSILMRVEIGHVFEKTGLTT